MKEEFTEDMRVELGALESAIYGIEMTHRCEPAISGLYSLARSREIPLADVLRAASAADSVEMRRIIARPSRVLPTDRLFGPAAVLALRERENEETK